MKNVIIQVFYGRIAIFEVLEIDDTIRELIVNNASSMELKNEALKGGYEPLVVDGLYKVLEGITTLRELNNQLVLF